MTTTRDRHDEHAPEPTDAVARHATDDQGADGQDDHGQDDHAHDDGEALGPVDLKAWGAGALGVALGLVVALCFVLATSGVAAG